MQWGFIFHGWAKKSNQNITNIMSFQLLFLIKKAAKLLVVWTAPRAADKSASSTFGGNGDLPIQGLFVAKMSTFLEQTTALLKIKNVLHYKEENKKRLKNE